MEFPGFNHFLSNCHLGADQSRADLCSVLGNFLWDIKSWLGSGHTWVPAPAVSEDHGQITEGVWALMASMPVCKVPSSLPSISKYTIPCHPQNQQSKCYYPHALDEKTVEQGLCAVLEVTLESTMWAPLSALGPLQAP